MGNFVYNSGIVEFKSKYDEEKGRTRYFIKSYATTSDIDLVNDIVTKGCMEDINQQAKNRVFKLDFDHETLRKSKGQSDEEVKLNTTKIPLGKSIDSVLDEKGNLITFELNPDWKKFDSKGNVVMTFDEIWRNIENGYYDSLSIAYFPEKTKSKWFNETKARLLEKVNIFNIALTGNPINPSASMQEVFTKSLEYISEKEDLKLEVDNLKSEIEKIKNEKGDIMVENNPVEEQNEKKSEDAQPQNQNVGGEEQGCKEEKSAQKEEQGSQEVKSNIDEKSFAELKSQVEEMKSQMEEKMKEFNNILQKALPSGYGPEDKSEYEQKEKEAQGKSGGDVKSPNTLNLIG